MKVIDFSEYIQKREILKIYLPNEKYEALKILMNTIHWSEDFYKLVYISSPVIQMIFNGYFKFSNVEFSVDILKDYDDFSIINLVLDHDLYKNFNFKNNLLIGQHPNANLKFAEHDQYSIIDAFEEFFKLNKKKMKINFEEHILNEKIYFIELSKLRSILLRKKINQKLVERFSPKVETSYLNKYFRYDSFFKCYTYNDYHNLIENLKDKVIVSDDLDLVNFFRLLGKKSVFTPQEFIRS